MWYANDAWQTEYGDRTWVVFFQHPAYEFDGKIYPGRQEYVTGPSGHVSKFTERGACNKARDLNKPRSKSSDDDPIRRILAAGHYPHIHALDIVRTNER